MSNENFQSGDKRTRENPEDNLPTPKKQKPLNQSTNSFSMSPFVVEESKIFFTTEFADTVNRNLFGGKLDREPQTPDTQPSEFNENDDNANHQKTSPLLKQRDDFLILFPQYQYLITAFYAMLDPKFAPEQTEEMSPKERELWDILIYEKITVPLKNLTDDELKLLNMLLEVKVKLVLEKLNLAYHKNVNNLSEEISLRNNAKSEFNLIDNKSQLIKSEILNRTQQLQVAAQLGSGGFYHLDNHTQHPSDTNASAGQSSKNTFEL